MIGPRTLAHGVLWPRSSRRSAGRRRTAKPKPTKNGTFGSPRPCPGSCNWHGDTSTCPKRGHAPSPLRARRYGWCWRGWMLRDPVRALMVIGGDAIRALPSRPDRSRPAIPCRGQDGPHFRALAWSAHAPDNPRAVQAGPCRSHTLRDRQDRPAFSAPACAVQARPV